MGIQNLGINRAVVVSGEAVPAVGWALGEPFRNPQEVVIVGPEAARAALTAIDGLRGYIEVEQPVADVLGTDVATLRAIGDDIFMALLQQTTENLGSYGPQQPAEAELVSI